MKLLAPAAVAAMLVLAGHPVLAQGLPPVKIAGIVAAVTGDEVDVTGAGGSKTPVFLGDKTFVAQTAAISIDDIKPGSFVGTAANPGQGDKLKGIELHVFPDSMRGAGEGFQPWDDGPKSSMTNGTLSKVVGTTDKTITVTYKGGQKTVTIGAGTPVVALLPADKAAIVVGAHIVVRGAKDASGKLTAGFITVGRGDSVPPI
jgi:hypothetical protein